jgi:chitodextrinase
MRHSCNQALRTAALFLAVLLTMGALAQTATAACRGEWAEGSTYNQGDVVTYQGATYTARSAHTACVGCGWNPVAAPSLWSTGGSCGVTPTPTTTTRPTPTPTTRPTPTPIQCGRPVLVWTVGRTYNAGDMVGASGGAYKALVTHVASSSNAPGSTPSVWQLVDSCGNPLPTPTPRPTPTPTGIACYPAWNSTAAYTGGSRVTHAGVNYEAKWWTQGQSPTTNSCADCAWRNLGNCVTPTPTPRPTPGPVGQFEVVVVTGGQQLVSVSWRVNETATGPVARWQMWEGSAKVHDSTQIRRYVSDPYPCGNTTCGGGVYAEGSTLLLNVTPGSHTYVVKLCNAGASICNASDPRTVTVTQRTEPTPP